MAKDRGIAMSSAEIARLLDEERTITLATVGANGMPHLSAMWYARDDETVLMWTHRASQKARNLFRDPRASLMLEAGETHDELRGCCLECDAELVSDFDAVRALGSSIHVRYFEQSSDTAGQLDSEARRRVGVRFHVVRARTWDHRRLHQ